LPRKHGYDIVRIMRCATKQRWPGATIGTAALVVGVYGCAPSCSCEGWGSRSVDKKAAAPAATGAAGHAAEQRPAGDTVSLTPRDAGANTGESSPVAGVFTDVPTGPDRARLGQLQTRLTQSPPPRPTTLAAPKLLSDLLPGRILGFSAAAPLIDGPTSAGDQPLRVVARQYRDADRQLYVKVTDTGQAAFMRDPVLLRLSATGSPADGFLHGRLVAGYPVVAQYYPESRSSQVMALAGDRYLIEVRMSPAKSPYEAQQVLKSLGLGKLAAPDVR
jgi:hypothetical protein